MLTSRTTEVRNGGERDDGSRNKVLGCMMLISYRSFDCVKASSVRGEDHNR